MFGEFTLFKHLANEWISQRVINCNYYFGLANCKRFAKFAKHSTCQTSCYTVHRKPVATSVGNQPDMIHQLNHMLCQAAVHQ